MLLLVTCDLMYLLLFLRGECEVGEFDWGPVPVNAAWSLLHSQATECLLMSRSHFWAWNGGSTVQLFSRAINPRAFWCCSLWLFNVVVVVHDLALSFNSWAVFFGSNIGAKKHNLQPIQDLELCSSDVGAKKHNLQPTQHDPVAVLRYSLESIYILDGQEGFSADFHWLQLTCGTSLLLLPYSVIISSSFLKI